MRNIMVKIVKMRKPFEEDFKELVEEARDYHQETRCIVTIEGFHPITGEHQKTVIDSIGEDDVLEVNPFTNHVVRRYLRLKGRLGEVALRMLSEELSRDMRLDEVKKFMLRVRAIRLAALRRSKAARMVREAELLPELTNLGKFFHAPMAVTPLPEEEMKVTSHLVKLGSSIVKRRAEKNLTLTMVYL
uniref:Uncharacterized protein n=1 Tax=Leersia perrieri TaxID=77586 RepID=A0A0D9X3U0_9ORYZ